jgi:hypothetical protein
MGFFCGILERKIKKGSSWDVKEKRTLAFYIHSCMTKKDLLIGGWGGVGQVLVAALQTVQCSSVFVIKSFKWQILQLTEMVLAYTWQHGSSINAICTGNRTVILFIVGDTDNLIIGPHILSNGLNF